MKKLAIITAAALLLGGSAAFAQPYCGLPRVNYIIDPATGTPVTQPQYLARYPWSNPASWTYDCGSNLWTDHTAQPGNYAQAPNERRDRDRERERERDRGRDEDRR